MQISYLADHPQTIPILAPDISEYWRHFVEGETVESREAKHHQHLNKVELPIALVAHTDSEVFGTAALRVDDLEGYEHLSPWLGGVFVREAYRGRGIGSALTDAIEQLAWSLGYEKLYSVFLFIKLLTYRLSGCPLAIQIYPSVIA